MSDPNTSGKPQLAERRQFGRRRTCKPAQVLAPDGCVIGCTVVDISDDGAKLLLQSLSELPPDFDLCIDADDFAVRCQVIYQHGIDAGVRFVSSPRRASWAQSSRREQARQFVRRVVKRDE